MSVRAIILNYNPNSLVINTSFTRRGFGYLDAVLDDILLACNVFSFLLAFLLCGGVQMWLHIIVLT